MICFFLQLQIYYSELRHPFIWKQQLGWVTSSPADVGTGLRIRVHLKLQHLPRHRSLEDILKRLRIRMDKTGAARKQGRRLTLTLKLIQFWLQCCKSISSKSTLWWSEWCYRAKQDNRTYTLRFKLTFFPRIPGVVLRQQHCNLRPERNGTDPAGGGWGQAAHRHGEKTGGRARHRRARSHTEVDQDQNRLQRWR